MLGWHTLETRHFIVHYHDGLGDLSERVARLCEETHVQLAPLLDWTPADKTHVILDDTVDTSNGLATIVPRNAIRLLLFGPKAGGSLGDHDDWLRSLIIHEYTHILHIDTIAGLPAVLNSLVGKRAVPNQITPRWFTEGYATYQESARTGGGRVRSSLFHMYLRTAYLDGALFDLGQLSATPYAWPRGSSPYLYGSHFLAYVAATRGEDFFLRFFRIYGARIVPFSLNNTAREVGGEDFVELYEEWLGHLRTIYGEEVDALRAEGVTHVEDVTDQGQAANSPRRRGDRRQVSFFTSPGNKAGGIYGHDLDTGAVMEIFPTPGGAGHHDWDPSGRYAVFHSSRQHRDAYLYNELILHDTKTGDERQLTRSRRARDPAFGPEGRRVVFVENEAASTRLVSMDLKSGQRKVLYDDPGRLGQLDTPSVSPDGRFVAVSLWRLGDHRDLFVYDLHTDRLARLTTDQALDLEPSFSPDGRWLVFSSDRTRIYDIYAMDVSGLAAAIDGASSTLPDKVLTLDDFAVFRVTRVERGLFTPRVVSDGQKQWLYVSQFKARGFDIGRIPFEPQRFLGAAPASRSDRPRMSYPKLETPAVTVASQSYAPWRFLAPQAISPLFAFANGDGSYGLDMSGFDPVGHHFWAASGQYFTETEASLLALNYSYSRLPVNLGLGFQHSVFERTRGLLAESRFVPFKEQAFDAQLSVGVPLRTERDSHQLSVGYNLRFTDFFEEPEVVHDPADLSPSQPSQGNFSSAFVTYFVGDTDRFGQSVTTEEGYSLSLTLRFRDEITGSDVSSIQASYSVSAFFGAPWLDHHVLQIRARGGFGRTDFRRREQFAVGGPPPQDVVTAIINEAPLGGTFLRGFEPGTAFGEQFHVLTAEYRYPLLNLEQGFGTLPFHFGRLSGAIYTDHGSAFNDAITDARFFHGVGTELMLETTLAYALPLFFRLGYAHGFGSAGIDDAYFFLGGSY